MPELPEVESTVSSLRDKVVGLKIKDIEVHWARMIRPFNVKSLRARLEGKKVTGARRRGKYAILELSNKHPLGEAIVFHLRMSGRVRVEQKNLPVDPYDRIIITFTNGMQFRFRDPRKFGRLSWYSESDLEALNDKLGPEPLAKGFTCKDLYSLIQRRSKSFKAILLDQECIAGLGNIYVDESLWRARLHPLRKGTTIAPDESRLLYRSIRTILKKAIENNGTDFGDGVVYRGKFKPQVYGRNGEPCKRCKSILEKIVVAGRSSVVCNTCQS